MREIKMQVLSLAVNSTVAGNHNVEEVKKKLQEPFLSFRAIVESMASANGTPLFTVHRNMNNL